MLNRATLLSVDFLPKAEEDVRIRTKSGAILTLLCLFTTFLLLLNEWLKFNSIVSKPNLVLDRERNLDMELNLDISFLHIPCDLINLDILDNSGILQLDKDIVSEDGFAKIRLDPNNGYSEFDPAAFKLDDQVLEYPPNDANYCGDCYGALDQSKNSAEDSMAKKVCCQTCEDVRRAYSEKGWAFFNGKGIEQCEREGYVDRINRHLNEGCRVNGRARINRIDGNLHFAPGNAFQNQRGHYHDTSYYDMKTELNFNHVINHLSFGSKPVDLITGHEARDLQRLSTNPLDGKRVAPSHDTHSSIFAYFTKIVPSRYEYLNGSIIETAQFSSKFHEKPANGGRIESERGKAGEADHVRGGTPGLYIYFEMSPLKIINKEQHAITWSGFVLNCITSTGGVMAVGTVVDKILARTMEIVARRKEERGQMEEEISESKME